MRPAGRHEFYVTGQRRSRPGTDRVSWHRATQVRSRRAPSCSARRPCTITFASSDSTAPVCPESLRTCRCGSDDDSGSDLWDCPPSPTPSPAAPSAWLYPRFQGQASDKRDAQRMRTTRRREGRLPIRRARRRSPRGRRTVTRRDPYWCPSSLGGAGRVHPPSRSWTDSPSSATSSKPTPHPPPRPAHQLTPAATEVVATTTYCLVSAHGCTYAVYCGCRDR